MDDLRQPGVFSDSGFVPLEFCSDFGVRISGSGSPAAILPPVVSLRQLSPPVTPPSLTGGPVQGLYVHVPFCFHKCHYCDFYSITRQTPERMDRFADLVLAEADLWNAGGAPVRPATVFFGGGTPSLLPADVMVRMIAGLRQRFDLSAVDEWTVEANPATVSAEYCHALRDAGVDRISFGAQSFDRADLSLLERHHDPEDVPRSIELARAAGFRRINLDLIFAVPGQTMESWMRSLETAISIGTDHVSCYALTFEPNTPITVRQRLGRLSAVEESLELRMLHATRARLTGAGRPPYEISNFAAAGSACRHNVNYWTGGNYLGLGPSAASHIDGHRWKNRPHLGEWETAVAAGTLPAADVEHLTPAARAGEMAMLMLRLTRGFDLAHCTRVTGVDAAGFYGPTIERLRNLGFVERSGDAVRLTQKAIDVADAVAGEFVRASDG
jgi:oxygen-independent coproporphyrinogen-3 oxidase